MLPLLASALLQTSCNIYYNSSEPLYRGVPCQVSFSSGRLSEVNVWLPHANRYYRWRVGQPPVTADPKWNECLRYTRKEGNQYQVCTVQHLR